MALVTVQRSPSPSDVPDSAASSDLGDEVLDLDQVDSSLKSPQRSQRSLQARKRFRKCLTGIRFLSRLRLSESYLSFKGAALILPQSECLRTVTKGTNVDIQIHLQSMFYLLRPQDTIKMAIKLESKEETWIRYMAVVITVGVQDTEESLIVGVDIHEDKATIGLVLPIWGDTDIKLNGDGGFHITSNQIQYIFKPVSVQAMWSAWQCLNKIRDIASVNSYYPCGLTHTWIQYYEVTSGQQQINVWNVMDDLESQRPDSVSTSSTSDTESIETSVRGKLREVMMTVDLEEVTSKLLRTKLEEILGISLQAHKQFINEEMIVIMRQMDAPSKIFDYLYLGSEWNASNLEELQKNGVGYILNVTREIDNFFPGIFHYKNIRVYDVDSSNLLKHWAETYKFINKARRNNSKVLVHCKMGVSRSASTVISFAMKDNGWDLDKALSFVKSRRGIINPNDGFMKQLKTYEGILGASSQRHNKLWRTSSLGNIEPMWEDEEDTEHSGPRQAGDGTRGHRPRSWSAREDPTDRATELSSDDESSLDTSTDSSEPTQFLLETDSSSMSTEEADEKQEGDENLSSDDSKARLQAAVTLLGSKRREKSVDEPDSPVKKNAQEGEHNAEDDVVVEHRSVTSGYDASTLSSMQEAFLYKHLPANTKDKESYMHLHPDVISECTLLQRKRRLRKADFYKGQDAQTSSLKVPSVPSGAARVKADDSWIKDSPVTTEAATQSHSDDSKKETPASESPNVQSATEDQHSGENTSSGEENSIRPYTKEAIPWSPGTVRRHAQDLECRMTTAEIPITAVTPSSPSTAHRTKSADPAEQPKEGSLLSQSPGKSKDFMQSNPSHSPGDERENIASTVSSLDSIAPEQTALALAASTVPPQQQERPFIIQLSTTPPSPPKMSTPSTPPSERRPISLPLSCPPDTSDDLSNSTVSTPLDSPAMSPQRGDKDRTDSVYESEDIQLPVGHVLRTKLEIEQRNRSKSFVELSTGKVSQPVQRSSSYREEKQGSSKGRFDRNSERRRTCLPVMQTVSPLAATLGSQQNMSRSDTAIHGMDDIKKPNINISDDGETKVSDDGTDPPPIVLEEGELLIRQGSVKRTKQEMEEKYCTSPEKATWKRDQRSCSTEGIDTLLKRDKLTPDDSVAVKVELEPDVGPSKRKLRHSRSSPQLCQGGLAYPGEEEITWSVGTVRQHMEAFESIAKDDSPVKSSGEKQQGSHLSNEILTMIRQVGTAWTNSPKTKQTEGSDNGTTGHGMVKRLTYQIEGQSASNYIQQKLVFLENKLKVSKRLDLDELGEEENTQLRKTVGRSASMKQPSPRPKDSRSVTVERSASGRAAGSPKEFRLEQDSSPIPIPSDNSSPPRKVVTRTLSLRDDTVEMCLKHASNTPGSDTVLQTDSSESVDVSSPSSKSPHKTATEKQPTSSQQSPKSIQKLKHTESSSRAEIGAKHNKGSPSETVIKKGIELDGESNSTTGTKMSPVTGKKFTDHKSALTPVSSPGTKHKSSPVSSSSPPGKEQSNVEKSKTDTGSETVTPSNVQRSLEHQEVKESNVKSLRGKFEGSKVDNVEKTVTPKPSTEESKAEQIREADTSDQATQSDPQVHKDDSVFLKTHPSESPVKRKTEATEVQQIVSCMESSEPLLNPHIKEKAIKSLFMKDDNESDTIKPQLSPEKKHHRYSRSMSSVPALTVSTTRVFTTSVPTASIQTAPVQTQQSKDNPLLPKTSLHPRVSSLIGSPPKVHVGVASPGTEQDSSDRPLKVRKLHGKSHPLTKLSGQLGESGSTTTTQGRTNNPIYNTL